MTAHEKLANPLRLHKRLLEQVPNTSDYILRIDNSTFELETTCSRQMEYSAVYGRTRSESAALFYGHCMHAVLEQDLLGGTYEEGQALLSSLFSEAPPFQFDEWRTLDHALSAYTQYRALYRGKDVDNLFHIPDPGEHNSFVPAVECRFDIPMFSTNVGAMCLYPQSMLVKGSTSTDPFHIEAIHVHWTGKIDAILEQPDGLWVMDHKTTSIEGPSFWDEFRISSQMQGYAWAGTRTLGRPVNGVCIDAIVGRKPSKTGTAHEQKRQYFSYTPEQLLEWEGNTKHILDSLMGRLIQGYFPMQTKQCFGKYGRCKYHDVCTMPLTGRAPMLIGPMYVDNTWSPLAL